MMRWFRFYNDAMRHPKVAQLSDAHFRLWVELLCLASENDGEIPTEETLKALLRRRLDHLKAGLSALLRAGLMVPSGEGYAPHGWDKRQYKSDTSTERSRKFREKCNVAETVDATPPDTEADTEAEKIAPKGACAPDDALTPKDILESWNIFAPQYGLPTATRMTKAREGQAKARLREYPANDDWQRAFRTIAQSPWLRGENDRGWRADIDFMLQAKSFPKLVEGSYGKN